MHLTKDILEWSLGAQPESGVFLEEMEISPGTRRLGATSIHLNQDWMESRASTIMRQRQPLQKLLARSQGFHPIVVSGTSFLRLPTNIRDALPVLGRRVASDGRAKVPWPSLGMSNLSTRNLVNARLLLLLFRVDHVFDTIPQRPMEDRLLQGHKNVGKCGHQRSRREVVRGKIERHSGVSKS